MNQNPSNVSRTWPSSPRNSRAPLSQEQSFHAVGVVRNQRGHSAWRLAYIIAGTRHPIVFEVSPTGRARCTARPSACCRGAANRRARRHREPRPGPTRPGGQFDIQKTHSVHHTRNSPFWPDTDISERHSGWALEDGVNSILQRLERLAPQPIAPRHSSELL
jgi:hypothetical protein